MPPKSVRLQAWREVELLHGPGDADVGEAALLLELVGLGERAQVGEDAVLQADEEDDGVLEPLGRVQGHQRDLGLVGVEVVGVGHEADRLEELGDVVGLHGGADELGQVLEPALGLDGALVAELVEVAAGLEEVLEQRAGTVVDRAGGAVEQLDERGDAVGGAARDAGLVGLGAGLRGR